MLEIRPLNFSLVPGEDTDFASYQGAELLIETIDGQKFNCSISSSPNSIVFDESSGDTKITLPFRESSNNVLIPANIVDGMNRIGDSRSELAHVADTGSMEVERDELVDRFISVCLSIPQRMAEPFSDADEGRKTLATSKSNGFVKQAEYANSRMSTYRSSVASVSASFSGIHLESSAPVEPTIRKIFGEKNLPISDYDMLNLVEEDRELSLDCSYWRTSYRLNILKLERSRTTALNQINVFYKLFFADASGKRIVHSFVEKGKSHKYFYKSSIVSKCINAVWNEEVNIAAEKYGSHLSEAKFICVELWDNVGIKSNSLLGELLVPLHSIEQADECNKPKLYAVQPPHSSPNSMKENCNAMGVLMIKLAASSDNTVDAQPKETATMKLVTHLRPIRSTDFSWPCRIISYSEEPSSSRLEDEVYHITLGTDGIRIIFVPSGRAEPESGRLQMLKTCQENNRFSNCDAHWGSNSENKSLDMIVPYSQVKGKSLEILTDSMLHLTFTIYRRLGGNSGGDVNKNYNYQNMSIDMIVGPCPALDFDTVLQTRISLYSVWCAMKNTMSYQDNTNNDNSYHKNGFDNDAVIDNDADVTAIDAVVKKIQGEIFSCVAAMEEISLFLHQSKSAKSTHVEAAVPRNKMKSTDILSNKSEHTQSVAHSTYNIDDILAKSYSIKQVNSQRVPSGDSSVIRTSDCSERNFYSAGMIEEGGNNRRFYQKLRIFVYRKAFLQVYLWYLVEFSSLFTHVNSKYSTDVNFDREYLNSYVDRTKFILAEDAENLYLNGSNEDAVSINNFGLIRHEDINLELSPQSTGRNDDPSTLIDKLELIMKLLQSDVRHFIMLSINKQATLSSKTSTELASILSSIIYKQYLAIVEYVSDFLELSEEIDHDAEGDSDSINNSVANSNVFSVKKSKPAMNPQRKRNLITFLISQDNLFELYLNPMLVCSKYKFSSRPFLSKCINFEQLLNKFYVLLNQNLTMWNARTVGHFLGMQATNGIVSNAAFSGISNGSNNGAKLAIGVGSAHGDSNNTSAGADKGFLPWEVTTLTELSSKRELFISNIPETVQTQLNIQIGLKKIPTDSGSLSSLSIKRIIKINQRIASSIAKAYLNIAGEYERVLNEKMNELFLLGRVSTVGKAKSRKDNRANSSEVYDDVIMFLISIVNDCCRINSIHIPEGVQAFVDDGNYNNNNYFNSSSKNNRIMLEQSNPVIYKYFFSPSKAYTSVARSSINYLSNQLLFNTELRGLLLNGLEKEFVDVIGDNGSCESGAVGENSCVEVMSATIIEFFEFVSDHLDLESLELLVFVVFLKWIMRYLLFLRDLQRVVTKSGKSKTTQQSDSATGFDFSAEAMNQHKLIKSHLRIILQTFCALQSLFVMKSGYGWSSADVKQQDITIESTDSYDNRKADMESSFRDSLGSDESGQKPNSHRESISDEIITIEQLFSLIENPPPPTNRSPDNSTPDHVSPEKDRVIYWTRHAAAALSSFSSIIATYISREFHSDEQANGGGNDKKKSSKKNKYINEAFENAFTNLIFEDLYVVLPQYQTDSVYLTAIESWLVEYPGPVIHILQQRVILIDNANRRTISSCSNEGNQRNGRPPRKQSFTSPRKCLSLVEDDISEVWRPVFHIQVISGIS